MPESEHKYLYERLTSGDFQQLVNAVLSNHYQGFRALPLGQADGGRDGIIDEAVSYTHLTLPTIYSV